MSTSYDYSRYLEGVDTIFIGARVPRYLVEKAKEDSKEKRQSFNRRIVELFKQEYGSMETEARQEVR